MVSQGCRLNPASGSLHGPWALLSAAAAGHLQRARLLLEAGVPVDCMLGPARTALHVAACAGDHPMASLLLEFAERKSGKRGVQDLIRCPRLPLLSVTFRYFP
jgi:ankyrin repeat protein